MTVVVQILLTIATLGYSLVPALADLNKTHATNPDWVGHARFHVVWQVASYLPLGVVGLLLVWWGNASLGEQALWAAVALAVCLYGGFFTAMATMARYDGTLFDPNGYPPAIVMIAGKKRR